MGNDCYVWCAAHHETLHVDKWATVLSPIEWLSGNEILSNQEFVSRVEEIERGLRKDAWEFQGHWIEREFLILHAFVDRHSQCRLRVASAYGPEEWMLEMWAGLDPEEGDEAEFARALEWQEWSFYDDRRWMERDSAQRDVFLDGVNDVERQIQDAPLRAPIARTLEGADKFIERAKKYAEVGYGRGDRQRVREAAEAIWVGAKVAVNAAMVRHGRQPPAWPSKPDVERQGFLVALDPGLAAEMDHFEQVVHLECYVRNNCPPFVGMMADIARARRFVERVKGL